MGKDDLAKKRGGRLKTAFDQQAANQLRVEFVDKNFNPINTINISPGDSSLVPESGYLSPEAQEIAWVYDGYNTLTTLSLHFELGRLIPQDIQASENPKLPLYAEIAFRDTVTDESVNLHSLSPSFILDTITNHKKIELEFHFVPKIKNHQSLEFASSSPVQEKKFLKEHDSEEAQNMASLRQGKLIRTIEVDSYDPKVHGKPFTLTLTQDPKNPYRYRSQTLRIEKFENLNIKIDGQRISFIPKNYVAENVDPALSSDRFHVQIYDPSLSTDKPVRAKLKTQSANSNQTKDSTTVFLYPVEGQPGLYRSASLMLTSYPEVDQYAAHGIADKKPGDPTVLAMPGDRVSISYGKKTVSAEVPIKKVLPVKFYVYKDNNGQPVTDQKWADKQITQLQKDLAPYGILVKAEPTVILDHPLHIDTSKKLTLAQQTLLTGITANNDPDFQGLRFVPVGDYTVDLEETAVGRAFVNNNSNTSFIVHNANKHTITHEVVHHLTYNKQTGRSPTNHDNQGHVTSPKDSVVQNLMEDNSDGKSPHSVGNHVISLTQDQIDAILANPILQDLPQPTQTIQQTPAPTP